MLEQELHNQELNNYNNQQASSRTVVAADPDLFRNYEIKNWEFSPRFYKILAASAIFNVMALFVFAQGNLLTRKAATARWSASLSGFGHGLHRQYSARQRQSLPAGITKRPNSKTLKLHIRRQRSTPPLVTQEGISRLPTRRIRHASTANANVNSDLSGFTMPPTGSIPTNPTLPNNDLMNVTPTLPPQNSNPIAGGIPTSPYSVGSNPISKNPTYPGRKIPRPNQ